MFRRNLTPSVLDQLFIFWTSSVQLQFAPVHPSLPQLYSLYSLFHIEQSGPWLALVLWLLKFSSNFSEVRTRTRTKSFKLIKQLLNFSTSVSDLTPLWGSRDLIGCLGYSLLSTALRSISVQNLQSVDCCFKQFCCFMVRNT